MACAEADAWNVLSYSPTTMSITTPILYPQTLCDDVARACNQLTMSTSTCESDFSVTTGEAYQSCMCNADMLYLASRCDIDGTISCAFGTPVSTLLYSYMTCRSTQAVATGTQTSSPTTSASGIGRSATSTYSPAAPAPTTSEGLAVSSASVEGGAAHSAGDHPAQLVLIVAIAVLVV